MKLNDISNIRLANQQISRQKFATVRDIVNWMGAMQSQDFSMSKWAIGTRLGNQPENEIEAEINKGKVLRTHILRPTWHLVSADNIRWLLNLTAPGIKAGLKRRHIELELSEKLIKKCNTLIQNSLKGDNHLTREELVAILTKGKINTSGQRAYHILVRAELEALICSGIIKSGKQTYALLDERIPDTVRLTKEESLKKIASIYFTSRGPATIHDFKWWSGLSVADSRAALEIIKPGLASEKIGSETYWFSEDVVIPARVTNSAFLLPAFDEFIISYKDRSAALNSENFKKAVSENGVFRPAIVINGQVRGIWRRTVKKDKVIIETKIFEPDKTVMVQLEKTMKNFGRFLGKEPKMKLINR